MTKYYMIAASGLTADQEKKITEIWTGYGWWHAIANCWLLRDHTDQMNVVDIRDSIRQISPGAQVMVFEVNPVTWAGAAVNDSNRDWLRRFWPPEGS